jgi:GxxExxY protein
VDPDEHAFLESLTERVLAAIFEVSNTLGAGFLEKAYERALLRELALCGNSATAQASFAVVHKGQSVGEYFADVLVEDALVVELKCLERLVSEHTAPLHHRAAGFWEMTNPRTASRTSTAVAEEGSGGPNDTTTGCRRWRGRFQKNRPPR